MFWFPSAWLDLQMLCCCEAARRGTSPDWCFLSGPQAHRSTAHRPQGPLPAFRLNYCLRGPWQATTASGRKEQLHCARSGSVLRHESWLLPNWQKGWWSSGSQIQKSYCRGSSRRREFFAADVVIDCNSMLKIFFLYIHSYIFLL